MSYYDVQHSSQDGGQGRLQGPRWPYDDPTFTMSGPHYQEAQLGATFYPGGFDDFLMPEIVAPSPQRIMSELPSNMQEGIEHLELEAREIPQDRIDSLSSSSSAQGQYRDPVSPLQPTSPPLLPQGSNSGVYTTEYDAARSQNVFPQTQARNVQPMSPPLPPQGSNSGGYTTEYDQTNTARDQNVFPQTQGRNVQPMSPPLQPQGAGSNGYTMGYDNTNAARYQNVFPQAQGRNAQPRSMRAPDISLPSPFPKLRDAGPNVPPSYEEQGAILDLKRQDVLESKDPDMQLAWAQNTLLWVDNAIQSRARVSEGARLLEGQPEIPDIEHGLRADAASIVLFLADQHHPKALFMRAFWYEFGKFDYPVDRKEAMLGYKRAAERGYGRAEYRIGTQYESMNEVAKSLKHYYIGVSRGDSASHYRLGMISLFGQHGQAQDYQLGIKRIKFAAEKADENAPQGAYVYGMLLARELPNINVPDAVLAFDIDQARHFIEKAALLGFAKAQLKMGSAYELCLLGCDFNPALSLHYNALASHQGEADADMAISKWFLCGFDGVFDKNEELAFTYAKRAAQTGLPTAEFALGYFYEIGMHVPSDLRQAQSWYRKAAEHGNRDAAGRLESISQQKILSKKDHEETAITRIKSQYGSRRGPRPERFREKPAPLLPMPEEAADMPSPTSQHSRTRSGSAFMLVTRDSRLEEPPRSKSTAPYPQESIRPKSTAPYPEEPLRPKSTAPYPEDDVASSGYGRRPMPPHLHPQQRPRQGPPADRPSSAFGIRPANVQNYEHNGQALREAATLRSSTSMGNIYAPEGRGSNPASRHRVASVGWEPQQLPGYRQPPNQGPIPSGNSGRPQSFDNNYPGRNRLQKPGPNQNKMQPAPLQVSTLDPVDEVNLTTPNYENRASSRVPPGSQTRHDARATLPSNRDRNERPERSDSMPQGSGPNPPRPNLPASRKTSSGAPDSFPVPLRQSSSGVPDSSSVPPRKSSSGAPDSSLAPKTSSSNTQSPPVASSQDNKPGKQGPQTFDEMGIPAQKAEGDCVVM